MSLLTVSLRTVSFLTGAPMTETAVMFCAITIAVSLFLSRFSTATLRYLIPVSGAAGIAYLAPWSLLWMVALVVGLRTLAAVERLTERRVLLVMMLCASAVVTLLFLREMPWVTALGAAYFTLRAVHVALDHWADRYEIPSWSELFCYMLFFPVFLAGPINRYPQFSRAIDRRRQDARDLFIGLERMLIGLFMVVVCGGWLADSMGSNLALIGAGWSPFALDWALSAVSWVELYFVFAGMSSVAIGGARIIGLEIEENFNHPYLAKNLVEFWQRWHISLTQWCRDYIYAPIAAWTRQPILGVFAAMMVLGLWHESSTYYVIWAMWQALGIVLSRVLGRYYAPVPRGLNVVLTPVLILAWLSAASPVALVIEGVIW